MPVALATNDTKTKSQTDDPIRPNTWIYFQGTTDESLIKIGESNQSAGKRLRQNAKALGIGRTTDLVLLCELRGMQSDEKQILRYFRSAVVEGEWFRPVPELVEYIRWLRNQWFVCDADTSPTERDSMQAVDSSQWLPDELRRVARCQSLLPGLNGLFDLGERQITGDDFYTNEIIIDRARRLMGTIDTDPASHAVANQVVKAKTIYTISDNGLERQWNGNVWLNPPFSKWNEWVPKILKEWQSGRVKEMCVLSAMRTVTAQYFAPLMEGCNALCIMHGRIRFWGGKAGDSPDDGHCVFYFGSRQSDFHKEFSELGTVFFR